ncbi:hypothetical protein NC653_025372 [Populus alba x Populus x berolinensis]|uniref:Uncharacterized protein n=1 Tax=Populus alba x Populus x berolinensis TaxID=444605 RepID=A0AAD6Q7N8_9ROSI|nr:hypothetical protein NC653_025372 [Populus alba x Populus x berolinensis]
MFTHAPSLPLWHKKMMEICGTSRRQLILYFPEGQLSWRAAKPFLVKHMLFWKHCGDFEGDVLFCFKHD